MKMEFQMILLAVISFFSVFLSSAFDSNAKIIEQQTKKRIDISMALIDSLEETAPSGLGHAMALRPVFKVL